MNHQVMVLLLGEVREELQGEMFAPPRGKSAPPYSAISVPRPMALGSHEGEVDGHPVTFELRGYRPNVLLVQARVDVADVLRAETFDVEAALLERAQAILADHGCPREFSEEYSIFVVSGFDGPVERFLAHAQLIASLLKSEREPLALREIEHTLSVRIQYGRDDLAIIDWDGAILFDRDGDVDEEIELLALANLQLLRHRLLDRDLDARVSHLASMVGRPGQSSLELHHRDVSRGLMETIAHRTRSISELQRLEREIKLIGDWYSARFYETATGKFKIPDWRRSIQAKLESLEDIYSVVAEYFSLSRRHRAEWYQIILFFILQLGWFALIILELFYFTRHAPQ
jgi:hypothetical protein